METMLTRLPEEAKMRQAEVVTMIEQLPENPEIEVTLRELKRQVMDWKSDSNTEESWSDTIGNDLAHSPGILHQRNTCNHWSHNRHVLSVQKMQPPETECS